MITTIFIVIGSWWLITNYSRIFGTVTLLKVLIPTNIRKTLVRFYPHWSLVTSSRNWLSYQWCSNVLLVLFFIYRGSSLYIHRKIRMLSCVSKNLSKKRSMRIFLCRLRTKHFYNKVWILILSWKKILKPSNQRYFLGQLFSK